MLRVECLQKKYELSKSNFQANNSNGSVTPYFWAIYDNHRVKEAYHPSQAVADNPTYIISAYVHNYMDYGLRKNAHIICYQNIDCENYFSNIPLSDWSLGKIKVFGCELIEGATFELNNDYTQSFTFYYDGGTPIRSMQMLWDLFFGLNANCKTVKEAELYYQYHLKKLELQQSHFTLEQYKTYLEEQKDLIKQHSALLKRIENLVALTNEIE